MQPLNVRARQTSKAFVIDDFIFNLLLFGFPHSDPCFSFQSRALPAVRAVEVRPPSRGFAAN
jgi:hypothetical protein